MNVLFQRCCCKFWWCGLNSTAKYLTVSLRFEATPYTLIRNWTGRVWYTWIYTRTFYWPRWRCTVTFGNGVPGSAEARNWYEVRLSFPVSIVAYCLQGTVQKMIYHSLTSSRKGRKERSHGFIQKTAVMWWALIFHGGCVEESWNWIDQARILCILRNLFQKVHPV